MNKDRPRLYKSNIISESESPTMLGKKYTDMMKKIDKFLKNNNANF